MTSDVKVYALEIEWCSVKQALANDPNPATQVLREPYESLQIAFNIMGHVHKDLFNPVKVEATGLPAFVKSVALFENDQLIMSRLTQQQNSAVDQKLDACLVIPASLLNKGMLKAIGGVLTNLQTKQGQILPLLPALQQKKRSRKTVRPAADTIRKENGTSKVIRHR
ncbi:hypothetical protein [Chitinophaga sp. S165]|uniref:hypothetical protein n=1 Tax=Chitinophaga sp. S165 TaxID=2135462 RepID=UPI000D70A844|nr:hypothetical protein [Chitinophaga sp. S165]PWV47143.1 hypothetical protein C7475_109231 [Chitinophaga sp. S165]